MPGTSPVWLAGSGGHLTQNQGTPEIPVQSQPSPAESAGNLLGGLTERLKNADGETLLLLGLLWMCWEEKADRKLLLALAYILL